MLNPIKQEVPATPEQDFTPQSSVWVNGKFTISRGTNYETPTSCSMRLKNYLIL